MWSAFLFDSLTKARSYETCFQVLLSVAYRHLVPMQTVEQATIALVVTRLKEIDGVYNTQQVIGLVPTLSSITVPAMKAF